MDVFDLNDVCKIFESGASVACAGDGPLISRFLFCCCFSKYSLFRGAAFWEHVGDNISWMTPLWYDSASMLFVDSLQKQKQVIMFYKND